MNIQPVPAVSIALILLDLLLSIAVPVGLLLFLRKRRSARSSFFLCGCVSFPLFALLLEGLLHQLVLSSPLGLTLQRSIGLYALYGGLAAGLFEEAGRFVFLFFLMKKHREPQNALMYGAGHGGIEAFLLLGLTYINNLYFAFMINTGRIDSLLPALDTAAQASVAALSTISPGLFLLAGLERLLAMTLHIALSVLVFAGIRRKRFGYVLLAVALHATVDALTILISQFVSAALVELFVLVLVTLIGLYALRVYRSLRADSDAEEYPPAANSD